MLVLYILSLVLLFIISVGLVIWILWPENNNKEVDNTKLDQEYRSLLQKVTTLLSEYEITHFVYGKTLSDLRNNRYLNEPLCIAVDSTHKDMIEGLEKYHINNDFNMSTAMFQLKYSKERFTVKNRGNEISARINYYKLENGKIKFDKYEIEMDAVFPIQTEVMDNLAVMMPSRGVYNVNKGRK
jgi:hypothetical protein